MAIRHFLAKELALLRNWQVRTAIETGAYETYWWLMEKTPAEKRRQTPIWELSDWDIAVVLDATRVDLMEQAVPEYGWLPNYVESIWSVGSASPEWIGETFKSEYWEHWKNAGYVTANPFSCKPPVRAAGAPEGSLPLDGDELGYLDEVWRDQWQTDPVSTVPPDIIFNRALWAWKTQDIDKLVIHAMQPHAPFRSRPEWFHEYENLYVFGEPQNDQAGQNILKDVRDNKRDRQAVWDAYLDNLHWGLEELDRFQQRVDADILVTSDHGNGMGEYGVWSHPPNNSSPILRRVPAMRISGSGTKPWDETVIGDPPVTERQEDSNLEQQLQALGYR